MNNYLKNSILFNTFSFYYYCITLTWKKINFNFISWQINIFLCILFAFFQFSRRVFLSFAGERLVRCCANESSYQTELSTITNGLVMRSFLSIFLYILLIFTLPTAKQPKSAAAAATFYGTGSDSGNGSRIGSSSRWVCS